MNKVGKQWEIGKLHSISTARTIRSLKFSFAQNDSAAKIEIASWITSLRLGDNVWLVEQALDAERPRGDQYHLSLQRQKSR